MNEIWNMLESIKVYDHDDFDVEVFPVTDTGGLVTMYELNVFPYVKEDYPNCYAYVYEAITRAEGMNVIVSDYEGNKITFIA